MYLLMYLSIRSLVYLFIVLLCFIIHAYPPAPSWGHTAAEILCCSSIRYRAFGYPSIQIQVQVASTSAGDGWQVQLTSTGDKWQVSGIKALVPVTLLHMVPATSLKTIKTHQQRVVPHSPVDDFTAQASSESVQGPRFIGKRKLWTPYGPKALENVCSERHLLAKTSTRDSQGSGELPGCSQEALWKPFLVTRGPYWHLLGSSQSHPRDLP